MYKKQLTIWLLAISLFQVGKSSEKDIDKDLLFPPSKDVVLGKSFKLSFIPNLITEMNLTPNQAEKTSYFKLWYKDKPLAYNIDEYKDEYGDEPKKLDRLYFKTTPKDSDSFIFKITARLLTLSDQDCLIYIAFHTDEDLVGKYPRTKLRLQTSGESSNDKYCIEYESSFRYTRVLETFEDGREDDGFNANIFDFKFEEVDSNGLEKHAKSKSKNESIEWLENNFKVKKSSSKIKGGYFAPVVISLGSNNPFMWNENKKRLQALDKQTDYLKYLQFHWKVSDDKSSAKVEIWTTDAKDKVFSQNIDGDQILKINLNGSDANLSLVVKPLSKNEIGKSANTVKKEVELEVRRIQLQVASYRQIKKDTTKVINFLKQF